MRELPGSWAWSCLDEVAEVRLGRQRSPKNHSGSRMRPYLRAANVTWEGLDLNDVKEMNFSADESAIYELREGDVVVAEASGSADEVGKPALWRGEIDGCCFQNTLVRVRSRGVLPEYLRYFLLAEARAGRIGRASPGVGIHHIGAARLSAWPVPVPPLAEQRRIVAAIEEQLSRLDAAARALQAISARVKRWGDLRFLSMVRNAGPEVATLGELCPIFVDCPHRTPRYTDFGIPALRPRDVVGGVLRLDKAARVDEDEFRIQTERRVPQAGDVIYSRELSFGWAVLVPDGERVCLSQGMVVFRPGPALSPMFLAAVLNSRIGRAQAEAAATGSAHPHINLRDIRAYRIPIPPLDAQAGILAEKAGIEAAASAVDEPARLALRRAEALRRSILAAAFGGELVSQDPDDDPASVLLERIATERAAAPEPMRTRREKAPA
jgi:type I restriction enzyme, S subunit